MSNSQQKKLNAFYHNQQLDYQRWLLHNTLGQARQKPTKRISLLGGFMASMLALTGDLK